MALMTIENIDEHLTKALRDLVLWAVGCDARPRVEVADLPDTAAGC
jgi:hypothetical protein